MAEEFKQLSTTSSDNSQPTLDKDTTNSSNSPKFSLLPSDDNEVKVYLISGEKFEIDSSYQPIKKIGAGAYGIVCSAYDLRKMKVSPNATHARVVSSPISAASSPSAGSTSSIESEAPSPKTPKSQRSSVRKSGQKTAKVAIKKIPDLFRETQDARRVLREIQLMRHFGEHPNIIKLLDMCPPKSIGEFTDLYLVMEIMHSDLQKVIDNGVDLSQEHIVWIVYQILRGVAYLHSGKVIHRDLKPGNILVNNDCTVKITDFGLARGIADLDSEEKDPSEQLTEYVMTRWYRAPEVMVSQRHYDYAVDIWSVGCILVELLNKKPLFQGSNYVEQLEQICKILGTPDEGDYEVFRNQDALNFVKKLAKSEHIPWDELVPGASNDAVDLLSKMLVFNPTKRISAAEALDHPFFAKFRKQDLLSLTAKPFDTTAEKLTRTETYLKDLFFEEMAKFRPNVFFRKPSLAKRYSTHSKLKNRKELMIHFTQSL